MMLHRHGLRDRKKHRSARAMEKEKKMEIEKMKGHILMLEHDLYYLMDFIGVNGLWQEAKEYLEEHEDDKIPFGCVHAWAEGC